MKNLVIKRFSLKFSRVLRVKYNKKRCVKLYIIHEKHVFIPRYIDKKDKTDMIQV